MAEVKGRIDQNILYIDLIGRIDASNAQAIDEEISALKAEYPDANLVLDADELEYISSAGLRIILKLRKSNPKLAIINVSSAVYEIFEMTGFVEMVTIKKAFRRLSVDGCEFIAKGSNGAVYRYDEETIVKVYFNQDALPEIKHEQDNARKAFVLGMNTAIPYDIVRIGEGYGTVAEMLTAKSLSKMIIDDPEHLEEPVKYYVDTLKSIHAIHPEAGTFGSAKAQVVDWANFLKDHLPADQADKLCALVDALPETNTLLHGDYHTNNVMLQNGETLIIDMDTLAMGHPIIELASMFNAYVGFLEGDPDEAIRYLGFPADVAGKFWRMSLAAYLDTDDEARIQEVEDKAKIIGYARILRRAIRRDEALSPFRIQRAGEVLAELLPKYDTLTF